MGTFAAVSSPVLGAIQPVTWLLRVFPRGAHLSLLDKANKAFTCSKYSNFTENHYYWRELQASQFSYFFFHVLWFLFQSANTQVLPATKQSMLLIHSTKLLEVCQTIISVQKPTFTNHKKVWLLKASTSITMFSHQAGKVNSVISPI